MSFEVNRTGSAAGPGNKGKPLILGRYELLRKLGEGSSGTVYACRDTLLCNWMVALKVFPRRMLGPAEAAQLELEVTALNFIRHAHVAKFYEFVASDDFVGFTMEYLGGGCVSDPPEPGGTLSVRDIVIRLLQVCSGLEAIHKARLIHRDLKPQNILISESGIVKVADFGIAMAAPDIWLPSAPVAEDLRAFKRAMKRGSVQQPPGISGTIDYMSPEQFQGATIDQRADIYSLGVIAYELLAGKVPFADLSFPQLLLAKAEGKAPALDEIRPDCPAELNWVVAKAMEPDPEDRYQSVRSLLEDLWEVERIIEQREVEMVEIATRRSSRRTNWGELWEFIIATAFVILVCLFVYAILQPGEPARVLSWIQSGTGQ